GGCEWRYGVCGVRWVQETRRSLAQRRAFTVFMRVPPFTRSSTGTRVPRHGCSCNPMARIATKAELWCDLSALSPRLGGSSPYGKHASGAQSDSWRLFPHIQGAGIMRFAFALETIDL